jgi:hypothetical protein
MMNTKLRLNATRLVMLGGLLALIGWAAPVSCQCRRMRIGG